MHFVKITNRGMIEPFGRRSLDYAMSVLEGRLSVSNACAALHAGGPGNKKKAAATSDQGTIGSTGVDGSAAAANGDDEDGDGDGDPDSDRRKKTLLSKSLPPAKNHQHINSNRILRMPMLRDKVGLSRSTIYEAISKGNFPQPISLLGARAVGWLESDIDAWLENRASASKAT